jgi:hypothetical protein
MAFRTYDAETISSTGAFLVGELERLDPTLHMPLFSVTWNRDIELREDVSISDESSSFTNTLLAAAGGAKSTGKNWIGPKANVIAGPALGINKTVLPMRLWGMELGYTIIELSKAQQVGRPIDAQKLEAIRIKHNMDIDEQVYVGDTDMGATGLVNNAAITPLPISSEWDDTATTPAMILDDINGLLEDTWKNAAYAACPTHLRLPPAKFALLTKPVTTAGSKSILEYVAESSLSNRINGRPLDIQPLKWLTGRGTNGKDRMAAYTKDKQYVRYPMVPLQRTPLEYRGISQLCVYYGSLGEVEFVYPETVGYADGL